MSDKIKGFTVALEQDVSEEYAQRISEAISMLRYVAGVKAITTNYEDYVNRAQVNLEWRNDLLKLMQKNDKK